MADLKITLIKSGVNGKSNQKDSLRSLGLKRVGQSVVRDDRPETLGMINVVRHLVTVEEVK